MPIPSFMVESNIRISKRFTADGGIILFIHHENDGKTYEEITEVLGLPTIIKDMGGDDKYIAYSLAEGQRRHAYFIFHNGKVVEEGIMYGNDYKILDFE